MRVIKKYAARKMYDVETSRFVNLGKLRDMILAGNEIQVIDNQTGNEITSTVLAQIVLEQQKKQEQQTYISVPGLFRELIKRGKNSILDFLERPFSGWLELLFLSEDRMKESFRKLVKSGQVSKQQKDEVVKGLLIKVKESRSMLESFIKNTIVHMNFPTGTEFGKLKSEVDELKKQLSSISANTDTEKR